MERATRTTSLQYSRARSLDATTGSPLADHGKRNVAGVPRARGRGLERLQHGTVRIKARTNSWRLLIMRVRNWKPAKPRRHRGRPPYTVTKNMLLLAGTTPNLRPYSLVFLTCRFDSFSNTHHGYAGHK